MAAPARRLPWCAAWLAAAFAPAPAAADGMDAHGHSGGVTMDEVCVVLKCRAAGRVTLELGPARRLQVDYGRSPYLMRGTVSLVPGESLLVEAEEFQGRLVSLRYVETLTRPEATLRLRFEQVLAPGRRPAMRLTVTSPFAAPMRYLADPHAAGDAGHHERPPRCATLRRGETSQHWDYPIDRLLLGNFEFVRGDAAPACPQ